MTFEIETRLGGTDGDNIVKTRLSTGEMTDIFWYNSGSLLQALNPAESLVDVSGEPWIANINESYLPTVSAGDKIFGAPSETAMGGGILYNKKVYADLGLSVPTTWAEFAANNEKIKAADIAPVAATFGDTWTSQLFVLADYFNVQSAVPDFAEKYTANEAHYADTPAALASFKRLQEAYRQGLVAGGLRRDQAGRRSRGRRHRHGGPLSDAHVRARHDRRELPRSGQRRRVLRPARRRRQRRDDLDAGSHVHRRHDGARRRGQGLPWVHRIRSKAPKR